MRAAIARTVAGLVDDDMAVVLDNGSTIVAIAIALSSHAVTALCLSLRVATALSGSTTATIVTPGGSVGGASLRYGGAACLQALAAFRSDVAIIGACAASPAHGLTAPPARGGRCRVAQPTGAPAPASAWRWRA